jgi:hypothetical protein
MAHLDATNVVQQSLSKYYCQAPVSWHHLVATTSSSDVGAETASRMHIWYLPTEKNLRSGWAGSTRRVWAEEKEAP